jgi:hypothetical protein
MLMPDQQSRHNAIVYCYLLQRFIAGKASGLYYQVHEAFYKIFHYGSGRRCDREPGHTGKTPRR